MKAYLRMLLNTETYQRECTPSDVAAGIVYHFPGPTFRRMSAEQAWDSIVTLTSGDGADQLLLRRGDNLQKTVIPVAARANVSIRLVGNQDPAVIAPAFEALLRAAAPEGTELEITMLSAAPPGLIPADAPAVLLGLDAFEEVLGVRPLLVRSGGAIPLVSELAARGVATVLTGFALNESNIHSPNERIPAAYLPLGIEAAAALYRHLARLG